MPRHILRANLHLAATALSATALICLVSGRPILAEPPVQSRADVDPGSREPVPESFPTPIDPEEASETAPPPPVSLPRDADPYSRAVDSLGITDLPLYRLQTESQFLADEKSIFVRKRPRETFLVPSPADHFDRMDMPTLGASWFQNRRTGSQSDVRGRKGDMGIESQRGVLPAGHREAAVLNEWVATPDLYLAVRIEFQAGEDHFGILFHAQDPNNWRDPADQIDVNTFHFVVASPGRVAVGQSMQGRQTVLAETALESKNSFRLAVFSLGGQVRVFRDESEVLATTIDEQRIAGRYVGVIGDSVSSPVLFDDITAHTFGGQLVARTFTPWLRGYPAASVRYQPIYYEHVGSERYGHHVGNLFQPPLEHAAFLADTIVLPWQLFCTPPWECHSDVGYCRPGDIVLPYRFSFPDW